MTTPKDEIAKYATQSQMSAFFIDKMGILNVKSYGAVGDGVTDDSTALQATINAATTGPYNMIWVPLGTYLNTGLTDSSRVTFMTNSTATTFTGSTYSLLQWIDILSSSDVVASINGLKLTPSIAVSTDLSLAVSTASSSITISATSNIINLGSAEHVISLNGLFGTPTIAVSTDLSITKSSASSSLTLAATSNILTAPVSTNYASFLVRYVSFSTAAPTTSDGSNGDIWIQTT
jgi:hypothetical protein